MLSSLLTVALSGALLLGTAHADTCSNVESLTSIDIFRRLELSYTQEQTEYWSTACGALKPSCILYPKSSDEVSAIVKILGNSTENFAVKSGGHNPNNYWASIDGAPLISTKEINHVILDPSKGTVRVGPGNRWDDVQTELDGTGWTVVGGRLGNVGVGGYLLGGGLSFMSQEYGWAANSILAYDIVLANGTITTASATKNPDLFIALKGGMNNFGIVTSFLLQGYKQGDIWGGNLFFKSSDETDAKLLQAVRDFTAYNTDDKAGIIMTAERAGADLIDSWIMFLYYNGPSPPEGTFANFTDAKPWLNTCKTRSYKDLLVGNNWAVLSGSVYEIGTETIPLPSVENTPKVMGELHSHWRNVSGDARFVAGVIASIAYQPFPRRMAELAKAAGGDMLDIDADSDRIIIELNYSYWNQGDSERMDQTMQDTYNGFRDRVLAWQEDGTLEEDIYLPLFANDAYHRQDYFGRLRPEKRELAKSLAEELDPNGFFRDRTGGLKP